MVEPRRAQWRRFVAETTDDPHLPAGVGSRTAVDRAEPGHARASAPGGPLPAGHRYARCTTVTEELGALPSTFPGLVFLLP